MIKRSMSRNTRAKSARVKHILQILLLLGVCIWLIYQVKHSHDKKKELNDDGEESLSGKMQNDLEFLKLGRKDLNPRVEETRTSEKHEEEDEEETGGEEEERKHEEEEAKHEEEENREEEEAKHEEENREEEGAKHEEAENEGRGGGDDEIDENDQESEENADFIDDEKEKDDGEGETETDEKGDKEEEEEEISLEDNDRDGGEEDNDHDGGEEDNDRDGGDEKTHEAREEQYKGDDASSAVTHDTRLINSETEETNFDSNHLEHKEKPSDLEETNPVHDSSKIMEEGTDKSTEDGNLAPVVDLDRTKAEDKSPQDSIPAIQLNEQYPEANDTDQVKTEAGSGTTENFVSSQTQQTEGETIYNSADTQNFTVNIPTDGSIGNDLLPESTYSNSNLTVSLKGENENGSIEVSSKSSNETESFQPEETGSGFSEVDGELGVTEEGTDGANGSENAALEDPIDSSDSGVGHEMEETRMDLDTLPEIRTEVDHSDETAAE